MSKRIYSNFIIAVLTTLLVHMSFVLYVNADFFSVSEAVLTGIILTFNAIAVLYAIVKF